MHKRVFFISKKVTKTLKIFDFKTYREDNLQGVNGPYLCHNSFKLNVAPDAKLDFIMKEDHKKSESFPSAVVESALTLKLQLLAKIISLVLITLSMY